MENFVINLLNGISYGMVLFLIASGMSVVMGAMDIINLSHGVLYMIGGYVGWTIAVKLGAPFVLGLLVGGLGAGLVGLVIERGFLRTLYKQPNEQVLLTFGFVYILSNLCLWVWGGWPRMPFTAEFLSGSIEILGRAYPKARFATIWSVWYWLPCYGGFRTGLGSAPWFGRVWTTRKWQWDLV